MSEKITESIINLTAEIRTIINNILTDYTKKEELTNYIKKEDVVKQNLNNQNDTNPITGKSVDEYITTKLTNYIDSNTLTTELASLNTHTQETLANYVTTTTLNDSIGENLEGHSFKFPKETQTPINKLITAGYYKYTNNDISTFYCAPDNISYNNALIRVEKQNDYIIQHIYSTLPNSNNVYQIDGREFVRHGYLTENDNDEIVTNWDDWKVSYLPWRKRDDLLDDDNSGTDKGKGENVDDNSFHIYECTAGYVFQWTQKSSDKRFVLPQNQYTYTKVHTFKELPIPEPTIFSNYIGHMDLKISKEQVEIRSSSNKGEYIVGVDGNYFVPRTN